jgi:hypothetical protein
VTIDVTDHAVERYVLRYAEGVSYPRARADLERLAGTAVPIKERSVNGQQLWRVDEPPMLLVVKPDAGKYVCVTVLPQSVAEAGDDIDVDDEVVAAYARIRHLVEKGGGVQNVKVAKDEGDRACSFLRNTIGQLKESREKLREDVLVIYRVATGDAPQAEIPGSEKMSRTSRLRGKNAELTSRLAAGKRMSAERDSAMRCLAVAIRALTLSTMNAPARAMLASIFEAEPDFAEERFWNREVILCKKVPEEST